MEPGLQRHFLVGPVFNLSEAFLIGLTACSSAEMTLYSLFLFRQRPEREASP